MGSFNLMEFYSTLSETIKSGNPVVLCVVTHTTGSTPRHAGSKMLVFPDQRIVGTIGGGETEARVIDEALDLFQKPGVKNLSYTLVSPENGDPGICGGTIDVYLEWIGSESRIIILGAGHVGQAVYDLSQWLDLKAILIDDRKEILGPLNPENNDNIYLLEPEEIPRSIQINENDFIVLTTRGHEFDTRILPSLLESRANYIGVIGSKRRWITTKEFLVKQGYSKEILEKIYSPVGLDIKAETPKEIALSILSEIYKIKNKTDALNLRI